MKIGATGTVLAIAAATLFVASSSIYAQEASGSSSGSAAQVKCVGANDCKGQSACKTASNPKGPGQNSCKGQGLVMAANAKECKDKGGKTTKE